jgi:hypothetical protein
MTELIAHARDMVERSTRETVSAWPRAAALLTRQHLEGALTGYWNRREPVLSRMNMRVQLACLRVYAADRAVAAGVAWTWYALSHATHHHPYELDPTREELASLIDEAERLASRLSDAASSPRPAER